MTVLAIILAATIAAALVLVGWLVHRVIAANETAALAQAATSNLTTELERARFELEVTEKALDAEHARAAALEEVLADEVQKSPNPDLARNDVQSRVLRFARKWREAAERARALPAEPVRRDTVPDLPAAEPSGPVVRPGET